MPAKVTAPTARSTAYDFNAHLLRAHCGGDTTTNTQHAHVPRTNDNEVLNVMPHEILFQPKHMSANGATRMLCASSLNGCKIPDKAIKDTINAMKEASINNRDYFATPDSGIKERQSLVEELDNLPAGKLDHINDTFTNHYRYIGVAVTGCTGGAAGALQRQGFSATRGGLVTVMNSTKAAICAGKRLKMQFDIRDILRRKRTVHLDGIPIAKIIPHFVTVDEQTAPSAEQVLSSQETTTQNTTMAVSTPYVPDPIGFYRTTTEFTLWPEADATLAT